MRTAAQASAARAARRSPRALRGRARNNTPRPLGTKSIAKRRSSHRGDQRCMSSGPKSTKRARRSGAKSLGMQSISTRRSSHRGDEHSMHSSSNSLSFTPGHETWLQTNGERHKNTDSKTNSKTDKQAARVRARSNSPARKILRHECVCHALPLVWGSCSNTGPGRESMCELCAAT